MGSPIRKETVSSYGSLSPMNDAKFNLIDVTNGVSLILRRNSSLTAFDDPRTVQ